VKELLLTLNGTKCNQESLASTSSLTKIGATISFLREIKNQFLPCSFNPWSVSSYICFKRLTSVIYFTITAEILARSSAYFRCRKADRRIIFNLGFEFNVHLGKPLLPSLGSRFSSTQSMLWLLYYQYHGPTPQYSRGLPLTSKNRLVLDRVKTISHSGCKGLKHFVGPHAV